MRGKGKRMRREHGQAGRGGVVVVEEEEGRACYRGNRRNQRRCTLLLGDDARGNENGVTYAVSGGGLRLVAWRLIISEGETIHLAVWLAGWLAGAHCTCCGPRQRICPRGYSVIAGTRERATDGNSSRLRRTSLWEASQTTRPVVYISDSPVLPLLRLAPLSWKSSTTLFRGYVPLSKKPEATHSFCLRNERQENTQDYFDFGFICRGTNYCKRVDLDSYNPDRWNKPHYRHRESRRANRSQVSFSGTERRPLSHCFFRRILGTGRLSRWDRTEAPPKYARASCSSRSAVLRASSRTALEFVMETSAR